MGYTTFLQGEVTIVPAIPEKDWPVDFKENHGSNVFMLLEEEGSQELALVDGEIVVVGEPTTLKGVMRYEEPIKAYSLEEDVDLLISWAKKHHAEVNGVIYGAGEEDQDRWRICIEKNVARTEKPEILWPNGDKGWW